MPEREAKIVVPAQDPPEKIEHSAAVIFIHGFGDTATTFESVANQFKSIGRLKYMQWVVPNALDNLDALDRAWYTPTDLTLFPSSRPELDDPEDEDGMKQSVDYIVSLIDELVAQGVPANRIVVGGFSQGCAMTLLTGLTSKYAGKLAGLVCLSGYMPLPGKIPELRKEAGLPEDAGGVPILLSRGTRDMLIPKRYFTNSKEKLKEFGVTDEELEIHEYEGLGHSLSPKVLQDVCFFFEKVVPPIGGS